MPKKKRTTSGVGFNPTPRTVDIKKGYVTLFDRVTHLTEGKEQSYSWYRNTIISLSSEYKTDNVNLIRDEKRDQLDPEDFTDENILRRRVIQGHLYLFEYEAKMKWLPYYDKFPLVYVLRTVGDAFYGANLHYLSPKKRVLLINKLKNEQIDIPRSIIHKYIISHAKSLYLDLASEEWETSILLPVENFVTTRGTGKMPYDKRLVWAETDESYSQRIKGNRIIKAYGNENIDRVK